MVVVDFPSLTQNKSGESANIVGNPNFENAIAKLQRGRTVKLAVAAPLSNYGADDTSDEEAGFAERALKLDEADAYNRNATRSD
ncbi:hypothetical protein AaE_014569 [Aphanomyces astaci]|uniref:Uncharacterized protein n=1 Tax=Aphanomyces astaci TaxID=112090 RepID=A0A6A4Z6Y4_APHAT|nr:hypothetical protein AaE_014569 [Aphanomyces astaci]